MSTPTEQELVEREVLAELEAGNWPICEMCYRVDSIQYVGVVEGCPSFACMRCSFVFSADLSEELP